MKIRKAEMTDSAPIRNLSELLGYPICEKDIEPRLSSLLESKDELILVAEDASHRVVGWIHLQIRRSLAGGFRTEIAALIVDPLCRRHGIGRRLVKAGEAWSMDQNYAVVRVSSRTSREGAHAFYEKLGYSVEKSSLIFKKNLSISGSRQNGLADINLEA